MCAHLIGHVPRKPGERDGRPVYPALIQPLQHDLVEAAVRAPRQERVQLRVAVHQSEGSPCEVRGDRGVGRKLHKTTARCRQASARECMCAQA